MMRRLYPGHTRRNRLYWGFKKWISYHLSPTDMCRCSAREGEDIAQTGLDGIRSVLDGPREIFTFEYPCHSPTE